MDMQLSQCRGQKSRSRSSSAGQGTDRCARSVVLVVVCVLFLGSSSLLRCFFHSHDCLEPERNMFFFFFKFCEATKGPAAQVTQPAEAWWLGSGHGHFSTTGPAV